jgi:hypothetical protein
MHSRENQFQAKNRQRNVGYVTSSCHISNIHPNYIPIHTETLPANFYLKNTTEKWNEIIALFLAKNFSFKLEVLQKFQVASNLIKFLEQRFLENLDSIGC